MTIPLMAPSGDVSVAKRILIPATVATAIGVAGLGGFQHGGERICTRGEICPPEKFGSFNHHDPALSIRLHGQVRTLTASSTSVGASFDRLDANGHAVTAWNPPGR